MRIEVRDLTVRYGRAAVLDGLSLDIGPGITGLLGPNGAGKTTVLSAPTGGIRPRAGCVVADGHDLGTATGRRAVRGVLGYLPQRFDLAGGMRLRHVVEYAAYCNGVDRARLGPAAEAALRTVGLEDRARARV